MTLTKLLILVALNNTEATYKKGTSHQPPMYIGLIAKDAAKQQCLIY